MTRTISILSGLAVAAVLAAGATPPAVAQMGGGPLATAGEWVKEQPKQKGLSAGQPSGKKAKRRARKKAKRSR
jgi:hypothetical protein